MATSINTHTGSGGNSPPKGSPSSVRHRRSSAFSFTEATAVTATATATLVPLSLQPETLVQETWGLQNLALKDKKKIIPGVPAVQKEFQVLHNNAIEGTKQRKYFLMGATGISGGTGLSSYYGAAYPLECAFIAATLSGAAFGLGYFVTKAQSDYSVNIKAEQDRLCQKLRRQYENLGKELILKYVEARGFEVPPGPIDEKANGNDVVQPSSKPKTEKEIVLDQAMEILKNWENIKGALAERLVISLESANDTALPLREAALAIVDNHVRKNDSEVVETPMQTFFKEQRSNFTIKQIEAENLRQDQERWKKLYEDINLSKVQVETEAAKRLETAKSEIAAEAKKQADEAMRQIEAAKKQAADEATTTSHKQLEQAIKQIETASRQRDEETAKQWAMTKNTIEEETRSHIAAMTRKMEEAIAKSKQTEEAALKAAAIAEQALKEAAMIKRKLEETELFAKTLQLELTMVRNDVSKSQSGSQFQALEAAMQLAAVDARVHHQLNAISRKTEKAAAAALKSNEIAQEAFTSASNAIRESALAKQRAAEAKKEAEAARGDVIGLSKHLMSVEERAAASGKRAEERAEEIEAIAKQAHQIADLAKQEAAGAKKEADAVRIDIMGVSKHLMSVEERASEREKRVEVFIKEMEQAREIAEKQALNLAVQRQMQTTQLAATIDRKETEARTPIKVAGSAGVAVTPPTSEVNRRALFTHPLSEPRRRRDKVSSSPNPPWK